VGELARVIAPPYDVLDDDAVAALWTASPYNVVHLIRPRPSPPHDAYQAAANTLRLWREHGVLMPAPDAFAYVYEHLHADRTVRGLLCAVPLDGGQARILPHEEVMAGPVDDRLALLRATRANLEPILLTVDGAPELAKVLHEATLGPPLVQVTAPDGDRHRVWPVTSRDGLQQACRELIGRELLIADGHHRYAAARRHAADLAATGRGPGPWDELLALVVDVQTSPLTLGAIHRVVARLSLERAVELVRPFARVRWMDTDVDEVMAQVNQQREHPVVVLSDGRRHVVVDRPAQSLLDAHLPARHSPQWNRLDTAFSDHVLIGGLLAGSANRKGEVSLHHDLAGTLRCAVRRAGTAVLLPALSHATVTAVASAGDLLPRKSTSFAPKPATGLLMRLC
jgi:uncharacterized protein (DUF1015 family)